MDRWTVERTTRKHTSNASGTLKGRGITIYIGTLLSLLASTSSCIHYVHFCEYTQRVLNIYAQTQDFNKGGGAHNTVFFLTAGSLESCASPKKALISEGGGGKGELRPFFGAQVPNGGGGGRSDTYMCSKTFFYVSKGGHMYKKGGGEQLYKNVSRGAWAGCAPPPPPPPPP